MTKQTITRSSPWGWGGGQYSKFLLILFKMSGFQPKIIRHGKTQETVIHTQGIKAGNRNCLEEAQMVDSADDHFKAGIINIFKNKGNHF